MADTDPDTLDLVHKLARTYQHLWLLIETHPPHCNPETISRIIQHYTTTLHAGIDAFRPPSTSSRDALKAAVLTIHGEAITLSRPERDLLGQLSNLIQLDEIRCAELWRSYLRDRVKIPPSPTTTPTTMVFNDDLLDAVINFYYEERVALINTISLLLRICDDETHPYCEQANAFVLHVCPRTPSSSQPNFSELIFAQFTTKATQSIPPHIASSRPRRSAAWAKQSLREQKTLLEVLFLLYYNIVVANPDQVATVIHDFQACDFGRKQTSGPYLPGDQETRTLQQQITALCTLISVEVLDLESLMVDIILPEAPAGQRLIDFPVHVMNLNESVNKIRVESTEDDQHRAPLLLAWACFLFRLHTFITQHGCTGDYVRVENLISGRSDPSTTSTATPPSTPGRSQGEIYTNYVLTALKLGVFHHLAHLLPTLCEPTEPTQIAYRSVMKNLLLAFCVSFNVMHMQQPIYRSIVDYFAALFKGEEDLSAQFWDQDHPNAERASLLETARARFPAQSGELVKLVGALAGRGASGSLTPFGGIVGPITGRGDDGNDSASAWSVFQYMAHLPTLTHFIHNRTPADVLMNIAYPAKTVTNRVPLRVFAGASAYEQIIPAGTVGLQVSHPNTRVVQWNLTYSGWRLLAQVLTQFVEAPNVVANTSEDDDPAGGLFLGDEDPVPTIEFVTDVVELFRGVLAGSKAVAEVLVEHMYNDQTHPGVGLWYHLCMVMERASSAAATAPVFAAQLTQLLVSCLRCLIALLPLYPREILSWLHQAGLLPHTVTVSSNSATRGYQPNKAYRTPGRLHELITSVECVNGKYPLAGALVDLVSELVVRAVRLREAGTTQYNKLGFLNVTDSDIETFITMQETIIEDLLIYLRADMFPVYAGWRYVSVSERYALGVRILRVFEFVIRECCAGQLGNAQGLARARDALVRDMLGEGGAYQIAPLMDAISSGSDAVSVGRHARRAVGAEGEMLVDSATVLAMTVVRDLLRRRRAAQIAAERKGAARGKISLLEHMILERTVGKEEVEFVYVMASFARSADTVPKLPTLASQVLTLLCRLARGGGEIDGATATSRRGGGHYGVSSSSSSSVLQMPSFVGYFGSPEQARELIVAFVSLLTDDLRSEETQLAVWGFVTAVVETQPGLATLFLSGAERPLGLERMVQNKPTDEQDKGKGAAVAKETEVIASGSIVRVALDMLADSQQLLQAKPSVLSAVMRFFAALWRTALDHFAVMRALRADVTFWEQIQEILFSLLPVETVRRDLQFRIETSGGVEVLVSDMDANIKRACADRLARAYALRVLAMEVHLSCAAAMARGSNDDSGIGIGVPTRPTTRDLVSVLPAGVRHILSRLFEGNRLEEWRQHFTRTDYDPELNVALKRQAELAAPNKPPIDLSTLKLESAGSGEDADDGDRRYGDGYVYSLQRAWRRCDAFKLDATRPLLSSSPPVQRRADSPFLGYLCAVNHSWSLVDSQLVLLRSYRYFLEVVSSRVGDALWAPRRTGSPDQLYPFLKELAQQIARESRQGKVMVQVIFELGGLLESLIARWVSSQEEDERNKQTRCAEMVVKLQEAIENRNFPLMESLSEGVDTPFHRPLFEALLLCFRGLRGNPNASINVSNGIAMLPAQDTDSEAAERGLRQSCRSLLPVVCASLTKLLARSSERDEYEGPHARDVRVTLSVLQELFRPKCSPHPSMWLPVLHQHETIPTLMRLYAASVVVTEEEEEEEEEGTTGTREAERDLWTRRKPVYARSILYTLLALANVPMAAERLAANGMMELLCDNALSPVLQAGQVTPAVEPTNVTETEANAVQTNERSEWHTIWCLMLAIVGSLLRSLYTSEQFLEGVTNFVQVYGAQFNRALAMSSVEPPALLGRSRFDEHGEIADAGSMTTAGLEEVERITVIFFQLSGNATRVTPISGNLLNVFMDHGMVLLQHYVYFFTHPAHLTARVSPLGRAEKERMTRMMAAGTLGEAGTVQISQLVWEVTWRLVGIVRNLLASFVPLTDVTIVMTRPSADWPLKAVFAPGPKVALDEPASTGTLTDCVTYGTGLLAAWGEMKDTVGMDEACWMSLSAVLSMVEGGLTLTATQLTLYLHKPEFDTRMKRDIMIESAPELRLASERLDTVLKRLEDAAAARRPPVTIEEAREVRRIREMLGSLKKFIDARIPLGERQFL